MPTTRQLCLCLTVALLTVGCGQRPADPAGRLPGGPGSAVASERADRADPVVSADRPAAPPPRPQPTAPPSRPQPTAPPSRPQPAASPQGPRPTALTPPATVLDLGTAGVVRHDRKGAGARVSVTPRTVTPGDAQDLARFDLDAHLSLLRPVYVEVSYDNVGDQGVSTPTLGLRLDARTAAGRQAARLHVVGAFPACEGAGGLELRPGDAVTDCVVFLVPDGDPLQSVSWQGTVDHGALTWTVPLP